jgi:hypothetical protein
LALEPAYCKRYASADVLSGESKFASGQPWIGQAVDNSVSKRRNLPAGKQENPELEKASKIPELTNTINNNKIPYKRSKEKLRIIVS